jgi:hypothetical protein
LLHDSELLDERLFQGGKATLRLFSSSLLGTWRPGFATGEALPSTASVTLEMTMRTWCFRGVVLHTPRTLTGNGQFVSLLSRITALASHSNSAFIPHMVTKHTNYQIILYVGKDKNNFKTS